MQLTSISSKHPLVVISVNLGRQTRSRTAWGTVKTVFCLVRSLWLPIQIACNLNQINTSEYFEFYNRLKRLLKRHERHGSRGLHFVFFWCSVVTWVTSPRGGGKRGIAPATSPQNALTSKIASSYSSLYSNRFQNNSITMKLLTILLWWWQTSAYNNHYQLSLDILLLFTWNFATPKNFEPRVIDPCAPRQWSIWINRNNITVIDYSEWSVEWVGWGQCGRGVQMVQRALLPVCKTNSVCLCCHKLRLF